MADGEVERESRAGGEDRGGGQGGDATEREHTGEHVAPREGQREVQRDLELDPRHRAEEQAERQKRAQEPGLRVAEHGHAAAHEGIPQRKLVVAQQGLDGDGLVDKQLIPVARGAGLAEMGEDRPAEGGTEDEGGGHDQRRFAKSRRHGGAGT